MLIPKKAIDKAQSYFWTASWQEAERRASLDLARGRVEAHETVENMITALEQDQK